MPGQFAHAGKKLSGLLLKEAPGQGGALMQNSMFCACMLVFVPLCCVLRGTHAARDGESG